MNIYEVIRRDASPHLGKAALIEGDRQISYGDLLHAVDGVARELESKGIEATQRVALSCADSIEYVITSLAVLSLGSAIVPVSPSYSRDEVKAVLEDIAVLTSGDVISEELGIKLKSVTLEMLGKAKWVLITKDATTVIDGSGKKNIEARISQIKSQIEDATTDYDKENCRSGWPNLQVVLPS